MRAERGCLAVDPVERFLGRRGLRVAEGLPTSLERAYWRAVRRGGYTYAGADAVAVSLGLHPFQLWGDAFYAGADLEGVAA